VADTKEGDRHYEPQSEKLKKEVFNKMFLGVFGNKDIASYFLKVLARSLAGEAQDKYFYIVRSRPNSGKGVQTDAVFYTFQSIYGNYNSGALCAKKSNGDDAHLQGWKLGLRNCRIAIANEKPNNKISGEAMKSLVSGGDVQTARHNHKDAVDFKLQCQFFLFCNDLPEIDKLREAEADRIRIFTTSYKYLSPDKYEASRDKNGKIPTYVKKADQTIKSEWLKRRDIQQAYAELICESWEREHPECPKSIIDETKMLIDEISDDTKIEDLIVETGKKEDKLYVKQLISRLKSQGVFYALSAIRDRLKDMGHKVQTEMNPETKKENVYIVIGIKLIAPTDDDDEPIVFSNNY